VTLCRHAPQCGGRQSEFALESAVEGGEAVKAPAKGDVGNRAARAGRAREGGPALQQPSVREILRKAGAGRTDPDKPPPARPNYTAGKVCTTFPVYSRTTVSRAAARASPTTRRALRPILKCL
jgi:hypothetical protein